MSWPEARGTVHRPDREPTIAELATLMNIPARTRSSRARSRPTATTPPPLDAALTGDGPENGEVGTGRLHRCGGGRRCALVEDFHPSPR